MKKKIFRQFALALCLALLLCGVVAAVLFDQSKLSQSRDELLRLTQVMALSYEKGGQAPAQAVQTLGRASGGLRITFINADGRVTADNWADAGDMESHAGREELLAARAAGVGTALRPSESVGKRLLYAVTRLPDGSYLRVSKELPGLLYNFAPALAAALAAAAVSFLAALLLARRFSDSLTSPLVALSDSLKLVKDGSATLTPADYPYQELQDMAADINHLSGEVGRSLQRLEREKSRIDYILSSMSEGFLLLDEDENILLCNQSAKSFLNAQDGLKGKSVLFATRNTGFLQALSAAKKTGCSQLVDLPFANGTAEAAVSLVKSAGTGYEGGLVVLISDVTAARCAQQARQEFFSGASHELKTPITSIRGFAELLAAGGMDERQQKDFSGRILKEADRMGALISDIILISRLESGEVVFERENLDMGEVARTCCAGMEEMARQYAVTLLCRCAAAPYSASAREMRDLINNLLSNAIQYNRPGGSVTLTLTREPQGFVLTVHNTGEPIPPAHQSRIFERFYRVDKSRSKSLGGTGLGLAIVKHIASRYAADITLESTAEKGTSFIVVFPPQNVENL